MRLYQKTGWTSFNELWVTDSTLNEGTNSLVRANWGGKDSSSCIVMQLAP